MDVQKICLTSFWMRGTSFGQSEADSQPWALARAYATWMTTDCETVWSRSPWSWQVRMRSCHHIRLILRRGAPVSVDCICTCPVALSLPYRNWLDLQKVSGRRPEFHWLPQLASEVKTLAAKTMVPELSLYVIYYISQVMCISLARLIKSNWLQPEMQLSE